MAVYAKGSLGSKKQDEETQKLYKILLEHNDRFIYFTAFDFDDPEKMRPELAMHVHSYMDLIMLLLGELNLASRAWKKGSLPKLLDVLGAFATEKLKGMSNEQIEKYLMDNLGELDLDVKNKVG